MDEDPWEVMYWKEVLGRRVKNEDRVMGEPGVDERGLESGKGEGGAYCGKKVEARFACVEMENERRGGWRGICICCLLNGCLSWGSSGASCRFFLAAENGGSIFAVKSVGIGVSGEVKKEEGDGDAIRLHPPSNKK